jgi:hypothetical protein
MNVLRNAKPHRENLFWRLIYLSHFTILIFVSFHIQRRDGMAWFGTAWLGPVWHGTRGESFTRLPSIVFWPR